MGKIKQIAYFVGGVLLSTLIFLLYRFTDKPTYLIKKQKIKGDNATISTTIENAKKKRRFLSFLKKKNKK